MARNRATTKNLPFDIDAGYLVELLKAQGGVCAISGAEFDLNRPDIAGVARWNAPSIDRIVPERGYIKGNIRIVVYQINCAIGAYGLEQFISLCEMVHNNKELVH